MSKITPRQKRFIDEYLIDLNATHAWERAGYKSRGHVAAVSAATMLAKPHIKAVVQRAKNELRGRAQISQDEVLSELLNIARVDIGKILDFSGDRLAMRDPSQIPESVRRCISSVKVKRYVERDGDTTRAVEMVEFKLYDKIAALRELALHLGLHAPIKVIDYTKLTDEQLDRIIAGESPAAVLATSGIGTVGKASPAITGPPDSIH